MILSEKLSNSLVTTLCANNKLDSEYADAHRYCLEQLFDLVIYHASLLFLGAVLHRFPLTILYIITLTPTKMLAGGAHAKSRGMCSLISYVIFLTTLFACSYIPFPNDYTILLFLPTEAVLWRLAPVCHPYKPLTDIQRKTVRQILLINFATLNIIGFVLFLFDQSALIKMIWLCLTIILINQIWGKILYRNRL
ncbi:MAG: accessory gene regulator B family protein [Eubacterium sp.]|nr:accessory gene regulator B family protein [Eubacterium sp.]